MRQHRQQERGPRARRFNKRAPITRQKTLVIIHRAAARRSLAILVYKLRIEEEESRHALEQRLSADPGRLQYAVLLRVAQRDLGLLPSGSGQGDAVPEEHRSGGRALRREGGRVLRLSAVYGASGAGTVDRERSG